jgi:mRNA interferase MazF
MPRFERWDVIAVPFPYVERPIQQRRPALVVAERRGGSRDLLWVLMITARRQPPLA